MKWEDIKFWLVIITLLTIMISVVGLIAWGISDSIHYKDWCIKEKKGIYIEGQSICLTNNFTIYNYTDYKTEKEKSK